MKRSSYKSITHLYVLLFVILTVIIAACYGMVIYIFSTVRPDGQMILNKWPIDFTTRFSQHIIFIEHLPQITETGIELLTEEGLWLQVIDEKGHEVLSYDKPPTVTEQYSLTEILELYKSGSNTDYTPFIGNIKNEGKDWTYIIGFPIQISKITIYVNANRVTNGKSIILVLFTIASFIALILGGIYGLWITRQLFRINKAISDIASRSFIPEKNKSIFGDVYASLNALDGEIRASDEERHKTELMREEWIANITHDLKTPLSPIRGYAELLTAGYISPEDVKRYGDTILKNTAYTESLVDDMKLTYQLKNDIIPINRKIENITRFLKELIIDILNEPKYVNRIIKFSGLDTPVAYPFDHILMQRAINNLLYNSLVHNPPETETTVLFILEKDNDKMEYKMRNTSLGAIWLKSTCDESIGPICILIYDNGRGMEQDELDRLFERYYRGTNTEESTGGTGLGMVIAKQIIELHGGNIQVKSKLNYGTAFIISFPFSD